jgi:hypothetical protein
MIDLAPVFSGNLAPALLSDAPKPGGFKRWISAGTYRPTLNANVDEIELTGINAAEFFPYLLFDYARFAMASRESIGVSFDKHFDKKAVAWPLINRYYSGFFAAHAILRTQNRGVIWIEADEAQQLQKVGRIYIGKDFSLRKGSYWFEFDGANNFNATVKLVPMSGNGGSHEGFWRYFLKYLSDFSDALLVQNSPSAAAATARFQEIRQIIMSAQRGIWLTHIRNEINYQHAFGTWFPFPLSSSATLQGKSVLKLKNAALDLGYDLAKTPMEAFSAAGCFLSALNVDLANLLKARSGVGAAQFKKEWDKLAAMMDG